MNLRKKKLSLVGLLAACTLVGGCEQYIARHYGGTTSIDLPACQKFETANWKGDNGDLWYITRPFRPGEKAETHRYHASTNFGVMQGTVNFIEHDCSGPVAALPGGQ